MKDFLKGVIFVGLFAIPFIPLIVVNELFFPFITGKNFTFRIIVEVVFAAWMVLALLDAAYRPRFSWVLSGLSALIVVMFFANFFGEYPLKSFWSNFERMDGYVTLVHVYLLVVVLGSTFRDKKIWTYFIATSVAAASYVAFDGLQQYINKVGSWRIDSTLGNASYMAIYMFFHAFFTVWLFVQSRQWWVRGILGLLFVLFTYLLILTATRGTFLALAGGLSLTALYLIIFARGHIRLRQVAAGGFVAVVLLVSSIFIFKDQPVIAENQILERISSVSLNELSGRFAIWGMAWEGVKQRPILGWGQGNFNYVFNSEYDPKIYYGESWYDRVHNLVLDWLIAGGFLGFAAYVSIFLGCMYYLFWRPLFRSSDDEAGNFTVPERAILIGILAGYVVHNLVVFDNIVSYIFFALVLGLIHSQIAEEIDVVQTFRLDPRIVTNIIAPVVLLCAGTIVYFVNVPGIQASVDIVDSLQANSIPTRLAELDSAIKQNSFAYQEVVEQLTQQAMQIAGNQQIAPEQKQAFISRAESELLTLAAEKPGDARVHVFISGFYRSIGNNIEAKRHIDIARTLSPSKPDIIIEQGISAYQLQDYPAMNQYFKEAFELEPKYALARIFYAVSFMYIDEPEQVREIVTDQYFPQFAMNEFALTSANNFKQTELLKDMFASRIEQKPNNPQHRASLAYVYYEAGEIDEAVNVLEQAVEVIPSFAEFGTCYIDNLKAGNEPNKDCPVK